MQILYIMNKNMKLVNKNIIKYIELILLYISTLTQAYGYDEIVGLRSSIGQIIPIIEHGLENAQDKFIQNSGINMAQEIILLQNNLYIETAKISQDYRVIIKFANQITQGEYYNPKYLQNKQIVFLPNVVTLNLSESTGNNQSPISKNVISGFECVTDIDENLRLLAGDSGTYEGRRSIIAYATQNADSKYLGNCIYLKTNVINSLISNQ